MAEIKSMTLAEAKEYRKELKRQGKEPSTSKEFGKLEDYIKTLQPEKYGDDTVQSAYEKLSSGVTERGGWTEANLDELNRRGISTMLSPVSGGGGDLTGSLAGYQDSVYGAASSPELRQDISAQVYPDNMEYPDALDRAGSFDTKREDFGVNDLEAQSNELKAVIRDQYASRRQRIQAAEGEPVAMGVIAGRVSEIERQEAERIDAFNRELAYITDQLNTAYAAIEMYMNFEELDYQDAVNRYNDAFNKNLQIYKLIDEEQDEARQIASANLSLITSSIAEGSIDYGSLSADQKAFIGKLEVSSGMPLGFTSSLRQGEELVAKTERTAGGVKYLDIITRGADGALHQETLTLGASSGSGGKLTESERLRESLIDMNDAIQNIMQQNKDMGISFEGRSEALTQVQADELAYQWSLETGETQGEWMERFGSKVWK